MISHKDLNDVTTRSLIKQRLVVFAGNKKLKIFGQLDCYSGKRMKRENRVFFKDEQEAVGLGFRRCKNCMKHSLHESTLVLNSLNLLKKGASVDD